MSRIGRKPINIPAGVEVKIDGCDISVKGPKGALQQKIHKNMTLEQDGAVLLVKRPNDEKENRALHGLTRSLIHNMVVGVTEGFKKELDVNGVGYRVQMQGKDLPPVGGQQGHGGLKIQPQQGVCRLVLPRRFRLLIQRDGMTAPPCIHGTVMRHAEDPRPRISHRRIGRSVQQPEENLLRDILRRGTFPENAECNGVHGCAKGCVNLRQRALIPGA